MTLKTMQHLENNAIRFCRGVKHPRTTLEGPLMGLAGLPIIKGMGWTNEIVDKTALDCWAE